MHNYSKIGGSSDFASRYPTRILVGYWLYSSEPEPDQHAVYGILSRDGKLRFKLVSETRAGRIIRGNYPPPSETWLIHEEIVLLPHLNDLNRLGMKEYCRERGRQIAAAGGEEESPEQVDENDRKAVEYAVRVSTVPDGQRPRNLRWEREKCADRQRAMRKLGTASAHAKAMHEKANGIAPSSPPSDLDLDRYRAGPVLKPVPPPQHRPSSSSVSSVSVSASRKRRSVSPPADEPAPMDRDPYKPPSPRAQGHRLPDTRPPPSPSSPSSFRAANARMDQPQQHHPADRLPPIQSFHAAANGHDDKDPQQQRLPPLHATLAADAMDLDDKERLPPIQSLTSTAAAAVSAVAVAPKPARQPLPQHPYGSPPAPRKALPTSAAHRKSASSASTERSIVVASPPTPTDDDLGPRSQVFNGMTYVRKSRGSFKGKLVSPGKIITIEGQDYVEYCVLAKLSFV